MDNMSIKSILEDELEHEIPSSQIQLWPIVRDSLAARRKPTQQKEKTITLKPRRISRIVFATFVIVVLLALVFITPQGRAFAQSILRFFIRADSDTLTVPTEPVTWVEPNTSYPIKTAQPSTAIFADDCGDFPNPTCSIEQIRNKVEFTVKEPRRIPEGMYFIGATGGPDSIFLKYEFESNSGGLAIFEEHWKGRPEEGTSEVGASAIIEKVQIGDLVGEYFRGSFIQQAGEPVTRWDPNLGAETLRWVDDGISYTLRYAFTYQKPLGKDGLIAIAESMTTEPVSKLPLPATATPEPNIWSPKDTYHLSILQAEELAEFKLLLPPRLPQFLSLVGASYDSRTKVITVFYGVEDPSMNGLTLSQQVISTTEECAICDIVIGDSTALGPDRSPMIVGANSNLEVVQIGNVTGKYVQGVWKGTDCCGWVWDSDEHLNTLRWQTNGRAYELTYLALGVELDKTDLIAIAESLK